jgi:hypothetical protein
MEKPPADSRNMYTQSFIDGLKKSKLTVEKAAFIVAKREPLLSLFTEELSDKFIAAIKQDAIVNNPQWLPITNVIKKVAFVSFLGGVYAAEKRREEQEVEDLNRMFGDKT